MTEVDRLRERGNEVAAVAAELARWSRVATENGDLHARLASALALWEEASGPGAGGRARPAAGNSGGDRRAARQAEDRAASDG